MRHLSSGGALLLGAAVLLAVPARADGTAEVTLTVDHGHPGDVVHVTVAVPCDATAVHVSLQGRSAAADEAGTTSSDVDARSTSTGVWEADLPVAAGLAAPQVAPVTAATTCAEATTTSSASFHVDAWTTQRVAVTPRQAPVGGEVGFAMTGGRGSCWEAYVDDSDGARWWLYHLGGYSGPRLSTQLDPSSDMTTRLAGSAVLDDGMALGTAVVTVHCSQTLDRTARFDVLPRAAAAIVRTMAARAGGTSPPDPSGTRSRISLGGGVPVVSPPAQVDPRFPLPTLAPPLTASPAPVVTVQAVSAAARGSWLGWWALLGLLVVPLLGVPWSVRRRRHRAA